MEIYLHKITEIPTRKIFGLQEKIEWVFCATVKNKSNTHKIKSQNGVFKNIRDWKCIG
jgi:hypothetical protein